MFGERWRYGTIEYGRTVSLEYAPKRLIESTKQLVSEALRLVKQGKIDKKGRGKVIVKDPKTDRYFEITDMHARDKIERPHSQLNSVLSKGGLFVQPIRINENDIDILEGGVQLPGLPNLVAKENPLLFDLSRKEVRKRIKQLKRAAIVK